MRERDQLGVDLGDVGDVVLDDLDRRPRLLLHPVEDLEAAPAAVAAQRVRAVGDVLELVEDEPRDDERAVDEARFDDLGDPAVDDRAGVDDDVRIADAAARCRRVGSGRADEPDRLGGEEQVVALGDRQAEHPEPEEQRDPSGSQVPSGASKLRQRQPEQQAHQQPDQQADDGGHELGGRQVLDLAR